MSCTNEPLIHIHLKEIFLTHSRLSGICRVSKEKNHILENTTFLVFSHQKFSQDTWPKGQHFNGTELEQLLPSFLGPFRGETHGAEVCFVDTQSDATFFWGYVGQI